MSGQDSSTSVSIVIPCYNDASYVGEAIESALNQTHAPVEVIVIDDGSTDGSLEVVRSFGERVSWREQENQGAPAARNHGLREAKGRYVKFLDADDVLLEDALERQVEQLQESETCEAVFGSGYYTGPDGEVQEEISYRQPRDGEDPIAYILHVNPQTSLPLHRREALLEVGGFDESLPRAQEYDLHLRLCLAGKRLCYKPTPITLVRRHGGAERITNQNHFAADPMGKMQRLRERERTIRASQGKTFSEPVRRHLAQGSWRGGRVALREGRPDIAAEYFAYARTLHKEHHVSGESRMYRLCVKFFGPAWAERISRWARYARRAVPAP